MRVRVTLRVLGVVAAVALVGCGRDPAPGLGSPDKLALYSIDGRDFEPGRGPKAAEEFHGYPVLGKVEVTDPADRSEVAAALRDGLARSDGEMAACFWPRHAIRVVEHGRATDYVICFECHQLAVYEGGTRSVRPVTRDPQTTLNRVLVAAGVPLAPGMLPDEIK
jgi:hypothetical protein